MIDHVILGDPSLSRPCLSYEGWVWNLYQNGYRRAGWTIIDGKRVEVLVHYAA